MSDIWATLIRKFVIKAFKESPSWAQLSSAIMVTSSTRYRDNVFQNFGYILIKSFDLQSIFFFVKSAFKRSLWCVLYGTLARTERYKVVFCWTETQQLTALLLASSFWSDQSSQMNLHHSYLTFTRQNECIYPFQKFLCVWVHHFYNSSVLKYFILQQTYASSVMGHSHPLFLYFRLFSS